MLESPIVGLSVQSRGVLFALVAGAVVVRVALITWSVVQRPEVFRPPPSEVAALEEAFADPEHPFVHPVGFEVSSVAFSAVCAGEGYSSPFGGGTGPTAWAAPGVVAVFAFAFATAGCFTGGSVLVLQAIAVTVSAGLVVLAATVSRRLYVSRVAGLWAAALVAVSFWDLRHYLSASWHDLNLPALGLTAVLAALLVVRERPTPGRVAACAAVSAAAGLVNPVLLVAAGAGLAWLAVRGSLRPVGTVKAVLGFLLIHLAVVGPYVLWQHGRLDRWVLVKSNLPFELYLGNRPDVGGVLTAEALDRHHPGQSREAFRRYRVLGEAEFLRRSGLQFVRELEPARFLRATARRVWHFFFWHHRQPWDGGWSLVAERIAGALPGLVLLGYPLLRGRHRRRSGDLLVYVVLGAYAAPYLVTGVTERYVAVLTPAVLILLAGLVSGAARSVPRLEDEDPGERTPAPGPSPARPPAGALGGRGP